MQRLNELLKTKINLSTAFHPETAGSTEVTNQVIEQYLRIYINYQQNDWVAWLALSEFSYNNSINSSTGMTPFCANKGTHPIFDPSIIRESIIPQAEELIQQLHRICLELQANLKYAQGNYMKQANKTRSEQPIINLGDLVFLNRKNIRTNRPSKKLDDKKLGPFKVIRAINPIAFELKLPNTMKIHPVFHISLLEPKTKDLITAHIQEPPPPIIIDNEEQYEVEMILDSRERRGKREYLIHWKGYSDSEQSWEPEENINNCTELLKDFYKIGTNNCLESDPKEGGDVMN